MALGILEADLLYQLKISGAPVLSTDLCDDPASARERAIVRVRLLSLARQGLAVVRPARTSEVGRPDVAGIVVAEVTLTGMATDTDAEAGWHPDFEASLEPFHGMDLTDLELRRYGRLVDAFRLAC